MTRMLAYVASPTSAAAHQRMDQKTDVRSALSAVHVPTLVIAEQSEWAVGTGRYVAANLAGAKFLENPFPDHFFFAAPKVVDTGLKAIRTFVGIFRGSSRRTGSLRPSYSRTSWAPPVAQPRWATVLGVNCSGRTWTQPGPK